MYMCCHHFLTYWISQPKSHARFRTEVSKFLKSLFTTKMHEFEIVSGVPDISYYKSV